MYETFILVHLGNVLTYDTVVHIGNVLTYDTEDEVEHVEDCELVHCC